MCVEFMKKHLRCTGQEWKQELQTCRQENNNDVKERNVMKMNEMLNLHISTVLCVMPWLPGTEQIYHHFSQEHHNT